MIIDSFIRTLNEVSIECAINGSESCRTCSPTNTALFTDDVSKDIIMPDPCIKAKETQIKAAEITVDDVKYYFTPDEKSVYDYKIFVFDGDLNSYKRMPESDPRFEGIITEIEKKNVV
jgi:hypothetical protein